MWRNPGAPAAASSASRRKSGAAAPGNSGHRSDFSVVQWPPVAHDAGMIREKSGNDQAKLPNGVIAIAPPSFRRERALIKRGIWPVAGCDEAGRGPLAGPVVAAGAGLDATRTHNRA